MDESSERREKLGGGAAAGVGFARLHRRERETAHVASAAAAAAVSITLRRDVVSPAHFRRPGKKSLAEMKMAGLDSEIPAAKNRDCLMPPESDWRLTSPEMELKLAWYCFYSDAIYARPSRRMQPE